MNGQRYAMQPDMWRTLEALGTISKRPAILALVELAATIPNTVSSALAHLETRLHDAVHEAVTVERAGRELSASLIGGPKP